MKILYFGTVCDLSEYEKLLSRCKTKPSVATIVFESSLLEGFSKNGAEVEIISCPMIPNYHDSKLLYWGRKQEKLSCGYRCHWLRTLNVLFFKQISRRLDGRNAIKSWLKKNRGESCVILSYGISPFLTKDMIQLSRKYGAQCCAIVPDLPRDMFLNSSKHTFKAWMRQCYLKQTLRLQGEFDSYVYLTEAMKDIINPTKPYMVMEGILNTAAFPEKQEDAKSVPRAVMYAGALNKAFGILNLIDAFEDADIPNTELWLFGDGNAVDAIRAREQRNPKIRLFGHRSRTEILAYERKASLLVNPRSTRSEYTKFSFPSKTIEYMYSGTPLLTTKLQGIPQTYAPYVFTAEDNEVPMLSAALKEILSMPEDMLQQKGKQAQRFVMEQKNAVAQSKRVLHFLEGITSQKE